MTNKSSNGGNAVLRRYGRTWFRVMGRKGGQKTVSLYGTNFMSLIGELGNPNTSYSRERKVRKKVAKIVASGK